PISGALVRRVRLAGHAGLFAPPELELLNFASLADRRESFAGRDAFRLEGLLRAVMELAHLNPEAATEQMKIWERAGLSTLETYGKVQELLGQRLLIDKTPTYGYDPATLARAEVGFEE